MDHEGVVDPEKLSGVCQYEIHNTHYTLAHMHSIFRYRQRPHLLNVEITIVGQEGGGWGAAPSRLEKKIVPKAENKNKGKNILVKIFFLVPHLRTSE